MADQPIHPHFDLKYALEGRIVTMDKNSTILKRGRIFIEKGNIVAIRDSKDGYPEGFKRKDVIKSGGTIYPGMIEIHNHLPYNILPYWIADKQYRNHTQWKSIKGYKINVTGPMQTLGKSPGFPEAIVRYVEVKSLVGGVTTSQGITLANSSLTKKAFHGMIRNVEETNEDILPEALTKIADIKPGEAQKFKDSLSSEKTRLLHLSEGIDDKARSFFSNLRINDNEWAITNKLNGIHCTALKSEDLKVLADHGGSLTWSPMSNLILYSDTANIKSAKDNSILIALGSDWSPSGSKNLLEELKVAHLLAQNHEDGPLFTNEEMVRMVTSSPAKILGWENALGSLEVGMKADMIVVNGYRDDPYLKLIEATEINLIGAYINGVPRYARKRIFDKFDFDSLDIEQFHIERSKRYLYFKEADPENILQNISLKDAAEKLTDGLLHLDQLANKLERAHGSALLGASDNPFQMDWFLMPDHHQHFDGDHLDEGSLEWGATVPFSEVAEPLPLDKLTTIEDDEHFRRMSKHPIPDYVREALPKFYKRRPLTLSDSAYTIDGINAEILNRPVSLEIFLKSSSNLSVQDKLCILDQAKIILEEIYVHKILKKAMYAVNPIDRINLMIRDIKSEHGYQDYVTGDHTFHEELLDIFSSLRDLHTRYILPHPYRNRFAFLPFLVEKFYSTKEDIDPKYIITTCFNGILKDNTHTKMKVGIEVLYWNNRPIKKAIEHNSSMQSGSNKEAKLARGLDTLTIRSLGTSALPDEHMVTLGCYDPETNEYFKLDFEWLVSRYPPHFDFVEEELNATMMAYGFDYDTLSVNNVKAKLYGGSISRKTKAGISPWIRPANYPQLMKGKVVKNAASPFQAGYIRIYSFAAGDAEKFVQDFMDVFQNLEPDVMNALILDIRGNGGGLITASELLLAHLVGKDVELQRAQFINSELTDQLCQKYNEDNDLLNLSDWTRSIGLAKRTGDQYSSSYPITKIKDREGLKEIFPNPKVLITDALCYSAADMFAAGFQDHDLGKIIGTHANTGAGGANVWSHETLRGLFITAESDYPALKPLPKGANFSFAVRRILRKNSEPIEDLGIVPDFVHKITKDDLLSGNKDLIEKALEILLESLTKDSGTVEREAQVV